MKLCYDNSQLNKKSKYKSVRKHIVHTREEYVIVNKNYNTGNTSTKCANNTR